MFCTKCGAQVTSGKFCPRCGAPLGAAPESATPQNQPFQPQPTPAPVYQSGYVPNVPLGTNRSPALDALRCLATSPLYLVGALAFSLAVVLSLVAAFTIGETAARIAQNILNMLDIDARRELWDMPYYLRQSMASTSVTSGIFGMIPSVLIAAGIWMVYAGAKDSSRPMPSGGFTMLKVMSIIGLVALCISGALLVLMFFILMAVSGALNSSLYYSFGSAAWEFGEYVMPVLMSLLGLFLVMFVGLLVLYIVYYAKLIKTINAVRYTATTGRPSNNVSPFVAVMCFIAAVFGVLSAVTQLAFGAVFSGLAMLCQATASVCFGMLLFRYRNEMRQLTGGNVLPQ